MRVAGSSVPSEEEPAGSAHPCPFGAAAARKGAEETLSNRERAELLW